jgi:hypothetical protein
MMATIRYQAEMLKSHSDYPITNNQWKLMNNGIRLWDYLDTLHLMISINATTQFKLRTQFRQFMGIKDFYLRERYNNYGGFITHDPWNRQFVVMPPEKQINSSVYRYYSYNSDKLNLNVDVIITTVNNGRVYCVDVVKDV